MTTTKYELDSYQSEVCLDPKIALGKFSDSSLMLSHMFSSHSWVIEHSKPHGNGVYVAFSCTRCGAIGHAIIEET